MNEELLDYWENGSEEERQIIQLALQAIRQRREQNKSYLSGLLNMSGRFIDDRTYQNIVPITHIMHNSRQVVHGGMTATILDTTMGELVNKLLPKGQHCVTAEMKVNYLLPAKGNALRAESTILHRGKTLVVCQGQLFDEQDRLVAYAVGTFMIIVESAEEAQD